MSNTSLLSKNLPPLAERIRPQILEDFIGQSEINNPNSVLSCAIQSNKPFSLIFWGPPGSGKTTLARILSHEFNTYHYNVSAISSGVKQVRDIINKGSQAFDKGKRTILFLDEIHRFNKNQQDALLHAVELGSIILIGATTENPSFEVISPLLSRCQILRLYSLQKQELRIILERALKEDILLSKQNYNLDDDAIDYLTESCNGDARKMLNTLEIAISLNLHKGSQIHNLHIQKALQQKHIIYDKTGDYHYDVISAYIKSIRGSDPDASIYWLAVMLEGGEKPEFIARRLIILASEDIGNAEPYALQLTTAAYDAISKIGMPESRIILSQITTYLASLPKSNAAYLAIDAAITHVKEQGAGAVPLHLRNATTELMRIDGYGKEYKYPHESENNFIEQNYFPETFTIPPVFYFPGDNGREKFLKERLDKLWQKRYK